MNDSNQESAFIELIQKNERVIYKACSFYVSDEHPLSDLYQEVVYNLRKSFSKFRNESSESTWIYRIALNTCISGMRKEKNRLEYVSLTGGYDCIAESDSIEENIKEIYTLIRQLKTIERAIILLYLEERSYSEIADITGLTVSNVVVKLTRIKDKMRKMSKT